MPKVMIEVDIPDGWKIPQSEDVKRLVDPDWMASWWHIDDVREHYIGNREYTELTDEECQEVLRLAEKYHDCHVGICWDSLNVWQNQVVKQREETVA